MSANTTRGDQLAQLETKIEALRIDLAQADQALRHQQRSVLILEAEIKEKTAEIQALRQAGLDLKDF